jgi:SAM-dependent methyltransferase
MLPAATPANDATPSLWRRLLAAERTRLWQPPADDERCVWLGGESARVAGETGTLELSVVDGQSLGGDLSCAVEAWPLRDDSVDRVVLQHVLERVADAEIVLDEAVRVLKPERSLLILVVAAYGWTRFRLRWSASGAPPLTAMPVTPLRLALEQRDCVDLRISRVDFDGRESVRTVLPVRPWSGLCLIEARKRRELPNVRPLAARRRREALAQGWIARPTSRNGLAA